MIGESLAYVLNLHLREQIRHDALGAADFSQGRIELGAGDDRRLRRHGRLHAARRVARPR